METITTVSNVGRVSEHEEMTSQMVNWRSVIEGKARTLQVKHGAGSGFNFGLAYPSM